jgi:hypothetical protein
MMRRITFVIISCLLLIGLTLPGCVTESDHLATVTISSTVGGEVTTPGEGTFIYDEGTVSNLVAEAEEGYYFVNWTGDVSAIADVNDATTTITMNDDYDITAKFAVEPQYTLIITNTEGGEVTEPGEGVFSYDEGAVANLVATPDTGYQFVAWTGDVGTIEDINAAQTTITMHSSYSITANFERKPMVAGGGYHTVGLKSDGNMVAVGNKDYGQCNVGGWADITQVATGWQYTVGLKCDGTVVAVGDNYWGQCDVGGWTDITQVAAGQEHTVGLKSDGTVVAAGWNADGQFDFTDWTDIIQVAASYIYTVGLKTDGTVVAVGNNDNGQCDVGGWTGITQVAAGANSWHTVGLKSDGTVIAVGWNVDGQCCVGGWTDITQVAVGCRHTVGLKSDGTVVAAGWNAYGQCDVTDWTYIIQVAAGNIHTVGLKADGTVVAVGRNVQGQCDVGDWMLT